MFYNYDGSSFIANKNTVAYYLDPRNFLTEEKIFMFEGLNYNENAKNESLVTGILGTSTYTKQIISAAKEFDISPGFLASRIKQEGTIGTTATKGIGTKCSGLSYSASGKTFNGPLYNFYNIGATSSPTNPVMNGLCYAAQTDSNTFRPWNTPEKAIRGGAKFIASGYINAGQYTNYFQKFNTSASASKSLGHQYMTNLEAPSSEATIVYNKYKANNKLKDDYVFYIPYYLNMPTSTSLPKLGNPNNWLKSLKVDGKTIANFKGNTTTYNIEVESSKTSVDINAIVVAKTSYVSVNGKAKSLKEQTNNVTLGNDTTKVNVVITAGNGTTKTYTINITKKTNNNNDNNDNNKQDSKTTSTNNNTITSNISVSRLISKANLKQNNSYINGITLGSTTTSITNNIKKVDSKASVSISNSNGKSKTGKIVTGDKIKITSGNESKEITAVIYGDSNGDGKITIKDIILIQRNILGYTKLVGAYKEAGDVNKDGKITIKDIILIQRNILGYTNISQI